MEYNLKYKCLDYWNNRYKNEENFEWFGAYSKFKFVIKEKIKISDRILNLG